MRIVLGLGSVVSFLVGALIGLNALNTLVGETGDRYDRVLAVLSLGSAWYLIGAVLLAGLGVVSAIERAAAPVPVVAPRVSPQPQPQGSDLRIGRQDSWS
jgi:hypothetical protein